MCEPWETMMNLSNQTLITRIHFQHPIYLDFGGNEWRSAIEKFLYYNASEPYDGDSLTFGRSRTITFQSESGVGFTLWWPPHPEHCDYPYCWAQSGAPSAPVPEIPSDQVLTIGAASAEHIEPLCLEGALFRFVHGPYRMLSIDLRGSSELLKDRPGRTGLISWVYLWKVGRTKLHFSVR